MNIEKHRAFLDSLEGEKGLPEEMHGISLNTSLSLADIGMACRVNMGKLTDKQCAEYWKERATRAESRQIPDLKELVKELMRDAMDAAQGYQTDIQDGVINVQYRELRDAFRALCAPEVKP